MLRICGGNWTLKGVFGNKSRFNKFVDVTWNGLELLKGIFTGSNYFLDIKGAVKNHWGGLTFRAHQEQR